jgi:hypothetical protein
VWCVQAAPDQTAISNHKEAVAEHGTRLADLEKATAERDEVRKPENQRQRLNIAMT